MIVRGEFYKLIKDRTFLFVGICVIVLNIYSAFSQNFGMRCDASEYKEYYEIAKGKSFEEAYEYSEARRDNMFGGWEPGMWEVRSMMNAEIEQLKAVGTYYQYLEAIDETAERMGTVSIFADKDSFSYKNIMKTPPAYDRVRSIHPTFEPSYGVLLATDNIFSDILSLFMILSAVTAVIYKEREAMMTGLLKPLKYGRYRLALSKTLVIFAVCAAGFGIMYFTNLLIGSSRFGLGDLSRPVQSLKGYLGCNLPITAGQFIIFTYVIKVFALFICALIAELLFIKLKNTACLIVLAFIGAAETALYVFISPTSMFSPLKTLNLAAFVCGEKIFKTYQNINLFGVPINLFPTTLIFISLLCVLFFVLSLRAYAKISVSEIRKSKRALIKRKAPKRLFSYSLYKQFILHRGAVIIIFALGFNLYSLNGFIKYYSSSDSFYNAYTLEATSLSSTGELYEYLKSEGEELSEEFKLISSGKVTDNGDYWSKRQGFEKLLGQYERALKISRTDVQDMMYYTTGWEEIFGITPSGIKRDYSLGLIAILSVCAGVVPIVAYDNRARLGYLLYTTKSGKSKYYLHAVLSSLIYAFIITLAVYVPAYITVLSRYGAPGLTETARVISGYGNLPSASCLEYLIILTVIRYFSLSAFSCLMLFISSRSKSPAAATVMTVCAFAAPIVIYLAGANFMQWLCWPISGNREVLLGIRG